MDMKKILIACFFAALMLMLPLTSVSKTVDIDKIKNFTSFNEEAPEIFITKKERNDLDDYVNRTYEEPNHKEANNIIKSIISSDPEADERYLVDMIELSNFLNSSYYYQPIPEDELNNVNSSAELNQLIDKYWDFDNHIFGELLNKIIELIKDRLGWIFDLFNKGYVLFIDGVNLAKDIINVIQSLPFLNVTIAFVALVNLIIQIPVIFFTQAIKCLFNLDFQGFSDTISNFTKVFTQELHDSLVDITALLEPFAEIFPLIANVVDYVNEPGGVRDFVSWIVNDEPWKEEISVSGKATLNGAPLVDATVTCREGSTTTDNNGNFELVVYPSNTSDDSLPKNSWYGMHNCQISISRDGEVLRQTLKILSYVFSGGNITWTFFVIKSKAKNVVYNDYIIQSFRAIFERIQHLIPSLFDNINRFYSLTI